jgi:hexosaminidase
MNRKLIILLFALYAVTLQAQMLIPAPQSMEVKSRQKVKIVSVDEKINRKLNLPEEGYTLEIKSNKAILRSKTDQGMVWAKATLKQLIDRDGYALQVKIIDYPAFKMRGLLHDTGRNFRSVKLLKKELDLLSDYKLNVFQWHLTDRPAWRIECKAYPQLNDPKYQRPGRDQGKYYTYDEIRDVIAYARERGIMVIPEIDMPGHSTYFDFAFGFSMASPDGMKVLEICLKEFFQEIPVSLCPYFHVGSDEVHVSNPKEFMSFTENLARENGRIPLAWDPGLSPFHAETVEQVWDAAIGERLSRGEYTHPYLDSYHGYLNNGNPVLNTSKYFLHQACGLEKGNEQGLGGILCLWNDVKVVDKEKLFAHNGMPNGLLSFAERFWRGGKGLSVFSENLIPGSGEQMHDELQEFEQRLAWHRDHLLYDWDMRWVANSMLKWKVTLPERRPARLENMKTQTAWGGAIDMRAFCQKYNVTWRDAMDCWIETEIYAEKDTIMNAMVGFESPSRANRLSWGIGPQGYWEAEGRLFVNEREVFPPVPWEQPGANQFLINTWGLSCEEIPYTDEQFFWMRKPAIIPMKKGKNIIRLYCPRVFRHKDWFVSFLPITVDENGHVSEARGFKY